MLNTSSSSSNNLDNSLDQEDIINPAHDAKSTAHDFFDDDDGGVGGGGFEVYDNDNDNGEDNGAPFENGGGMSMSVSMGGGGVYEPFNPARRNERDLFMAMVGAGEEGGGEGGEAGEMFGYFDRDLLGKNWVGRPEHWKMRRKVLKKGE